MAVVNKIGTYLPNPPARVSVATNAAIQVVNRDTAYYPQNPIVPGTQAYDSVYVREPGNLVFDPVTGLHIVVYSGSPGTVTFEIVACAYLSIDGETGWYPHPQNPILTGRRSEDPYLCKNIDTGHLYRDGSGRAFLYAEEKPSFDGQRGIELWRSEPNRLDGWSYYGRVVDMGPSGAWDETFRASPIIFHDGTNFTMVFEGGSPTNEGELGVARSSDGYAWTVDSTPMVTRGSAGAWNDQAVVNDDIMKIGSSYVMLTHCKGSRVGNGTNFNNLGRYITNDAPSSWGPSSWTEMPGNPFYVGNSNTSMFVHNDPGRLLIVIDNDTYWYADVALA